MTAAMVELHLTCHDNILQQFAYSRGSSGLDFRSLLRPVFEQAIRSMVERRFAAAAHNFAANLPDKAFVSHAIIGSQNIETQDDSETLIIPLTLMSYPIVAVFTNDVLSILRDLTE